MCSRVATGDNARFLRFWWECYKKLIQFDRVALAETSPQKWVPCDKGGDFRRWAGNNEYVVDWTGNGKKLFDFPGSTPRNREITFKNALACSKITSGQLLSGDAAMDSRIACCCCLIRLDLIV